MYLVDFITRITRKSNIPVLIYLVLNIFIIAGIINVAMSESRQPFWLSFLIAIALYALSLLIALSPIGEAIIRFQTHCKRIKRKDQINYLEPIFREVYARARRLDPSIPNDVQLYMNDDEAPNAFATGRKTICVTAGMMDMPEDQIKATLAHEFGHLAHKDTDLILVVAVGNMFVSAVIMFINICITIFHFVMSIASLAIGGSEGVVAYAVNGLYHLMLTAFVSGLTWLWTKIGVLLVMKSSRANEYEADEFAFNLGYGDDLCILLDSIDSSSGAKGLFASLASSHPDTDDRIQRLQDLGAGYRMSYGRR